MTAMQTILALFIPKPEDHETVEATVENVIFDLKNATQANLAVTNLLNDVLTGR